MTLESPVPTHPSVFSRAWAPLGLLVAVSACFLPALGAGFVNFDDNVNFLQNLHYRGLGPDQLRWMFSDFYGHYMPVTWITLGLDYVLWGMNPLGYHLSSLAFHAVGVLLFHRLALLLLSIRDPEPSDSTRRQAFAAALLFAIHPLRVESVVWITERRDVVSGLFLFLSVFAYLEVRRRTLSRLRTHAWLALSVAAFALSLLSKTTGMALPVVLLVLDLHPLRRWVPGMGAGPLLRLVVEKLPFFALSLAAAVVTFAAQERAGAFSAPGAYTMLDRLLQPGTRLCFYLWKTFLPVNLSPQYPLKPTDPWAALPCTVFVLALTGMLIVWRRRVPSALAAWTAFVVLLAPVLGILQAGPHFAADRYTYLACLPLCLLFARCVAAPGAERTAVAAAVFVLLGVLTFRQAGVWRDSLHLWDHALAINPEFETAYYNRGLARMAAGDPASAIRDFTHALDLAPRQARTYNNRALARTRLGDLAGAADDYTEAIRLRPGDASLLLNRAMVRAMRGDLQGVVDDCTEAIRLDAGSAGAHANRGIAWSLLGEPDRAMADFTRALVLDPARIEAYAERGRLRAAKGDRAGAAADFEEALRRAPPGWPYRADVERERRGLETTP